MTVDNFYSRWVLFSKEKKQKSLERLKNDKDGKWSGEQLEAVNELVQDMENHLSKL